MIEHAEFVANAHLRKTSIWLIFVEPQFVAHKKINLIKYHLRVRAVFFNSEDLLTKREASSVTGVTLSYKMFTGQCK